MARKAKETDKETAKIEEIGQAVKDLVGSSGWGEARRRLLKKVAQLKNISNLTDISDPSTIMQVIAAKNTAADILVAWLRDVEGTAEQHDGNAALIEKEIEGLVMELE